MMAIDARGGESYLKAQGLNLPQDICTAEESVRVVAALDARTARYAPEIRRP